MTQANPDLGGGGPGAAQPWRLLVLCLAFGAAASLASRADANWDLQNYHLYAPFAAWNGRIGLDYFAAGFQGYFNPIVDFPYFVAKLILFPGHPAITAALAGLPFGTLAFLVIGIAEILVPRASPEESGWCLPWVKLRLSSLLAAGIGLSGATVLSEIGTSYGDIAMTDAMLLGVFGMLKLWPSSPRAGMAMGLGIGCAAALKLTALIYPPGAAIWLLLGAADRRAAVLRLIWLAAAAAAGFLLLWGWWGLTLWRQFHNPFFPLFSRIFASPWSIDLTASDPRFFPRSVLQWIAYPFFWLQGQDFVASEAKLRDPRFALTYLALLAAGLRALLSRRRPPDRRVLGLWLFLAVAYACWLVGFSVLRYAMPLEALSGIAMLTALRYACAPGWFSLIPGRGLWRVAAVLLVFCLATTKPIGWGRIDYGRDLVEAPIPALPGNAVVFIVGGPLGFVVPYIAAADTRFIQPDFVTATSPENDVVKRSIDDGAPLFVLTNMPTNSVTASLARAGLSPSEDDCRVIRSPVRPAIRLCAVHPVH